MKIFFVKTQTDCNPHRLHSLDIAEFSTTDLAEAYRVFNDEVAQL